MQIKLACMGRTKTVGLELLDRWVYPAVWVHGNWQWLAGTSNTESSCTRVASTQVVAHHATRHYAQLRNSHTFAGSSSGKSFVFAIPWQKFLLYSGAAWHVVQQLPSQVSAQAQPVEHAKEQRKQRVNTEVQACVHARSTNINCWEDGGDSFDRMNQSKTSVRQGQRRTCSSKSRCNRRLPVVRAAVLSSCTVKYKDEDSSNIALEQHSSISAMNGTTSIGAAREETERSTPAWTVVKAANVQGPPLELPSNLKNAKPKTMDGTSSSRPDRSCFILSLSFSISSADAPPSPPSVERKAIFFSSFLIAR